MKHTPEPWEYDGNKKITSIHRGKTYQQIAEIGTPGCRIALVDQANGYLMAAAPDEHTSLKEMVAVCSAAMRVLAHCDLEAEFADELKRAGVKNGFGKRALDALRKAEGKETP